MVTETLDTIILLLAGASILAALFYGLRAWGYRSRAARANYGVAQQETRQAMRVDMVRGIMAVFVGLILFGVVGLSWGPADNDMSTAPAATPEATTRAPTVAATATLPPSVTTMPTETSVPVLTEPPTPTVTATAFLLTPTPTTEPTPVATTQPTTATVNSEVGVWLREAPGIETETLEWLLDGTVLTLLPGVDSADELDWQQVISPEGNEGWVAVPYIVYNE